MRPKSSFLASTQLMFGGGMLPVTTRTPSPLSNMEVENYALGMFFCEEDMTTAPHQRDDGWGHVPSGPEH